MIEVKKCSKCGIEKELNRNNFQWRNDNNKWRDQCKNCLATHKAQYAQDHKEEIKEHNVQYYQNNKEKIKAQVSQYREDHKEEIKEYQIQWYQENKEEILEDRKIYRQDNEEKIKECARLYRQSHKEEIKMRNAQYNAKPENKEKINANRRNRRKNDSSFRLRSNMSKSIHKSLKRSGSSKNGGSCMDYLPYTIEELWAHLESQFEPWMTRENQGNYNAKTWNDNDDSTKTWQLDHIQPHSDFLYTSMEDESFKECWKLSNLRPYSAKQNVIDGTTRIRHQKKTIKE